MKSTTGFVMQGSRNLVCQNQKRKSLMIKMLKSEENYLSVITDLLRESNVIDAGHLLHRVMRLHTVTFKQICK